MTTLTNLNKDTLLIILGKLKADSQVKAASTCKQTLALSKNRLNAYKNIHQVLTHGLEEIRQLKTCAQYPKNVKTYLGKLVSSGSKARLGKNQEAKIKIELLRFMFMELASKNLPRQISKKMVNDVVNESSNADVTEFDKMSDMYKTMMQIYC